MTIGELRQRDVRTFKTSRGLVVETYLTDAEAVQLLQKYYDKLDNFGQSLARDSLSKRGLTLNQWPWAHKLVLEQLPAACNPRGRRSRARKSSPSTLRRSRRSWRRLTRS